MAIFSFDIFYKITTGFCSCLYISWISSAFRILNSSDRKWVSEDGAFRMETLSLKNLFEDSQIEFLFY